MKIHEYQAKEILRKYGVPVPAGEMATTLEEADTAAKSLFATGNAVVVVKAQIHAGGRGKGGGVKVAKSLDDANARVQGHPRHAAGHAPDRAAGPEGAAPAHRRGLGHRSRALPRPGPRPRSAQGRLHGLAVRRHGDRRGRARHPGRDLQGVHRPGASASSPTRPASSPSSSASKPTQINEAVDVHAGPVQGLRRDRLAR